MKFTLTLAGPMAQMVEAVAVQRGISEQEAVRVILGQVLVLGVQTLQIPQTLQILENLQNPQNPGTPPATRVEESSSKSSPEEKKEEKQKTHCAGQGGELVLFPEIPVVDAAKDLARKKREAEKEAELAWRVGEVWSAFLYARQCFFREHNGVRPGVEPALDPVRQYIRAALLRHDKHLLAPEDRDHWRRESSARGAGIGIFHDPFFTGTSKDNDAHAGGKRYLEPWRPWRVQRDKPDPVPRFAEIYFEIRDVSEAAR